MKKKKTEVNLLDLKPIQNVKWEVGDNGNAVLLIPKFKNGMLAKYVTPKLKRPNFRVKLDDFGSFVWNQCDGNNTVADIAASLRRVHGASAEPAEERIGAFIRKLEDGHLIMINY
ncbi:MAG: PqqD family protein [bacterium]